ncbi:MAG: Crp/Fnr family transcriptional regulator [Allosphingosinicella sp.]|uniref:Crp/Fnr family transcriptional regulator n=1 Tax=Allosphingosinicella sp. TaxID=2823234 RepID=UPI003926F110
MRLTDSERRALEALEEQERVFRRGAVVVSEHDARRELYVVQEGWLHSAVLLGNGNRQIMRFHFPGDIVGISVLAFGESAETVTAVTDATLCPFDRDRLAELFERHPRLSALIFTLAVADRVTLADRLASIGRTSARARVASLLCQIFARLRLLHDGARDDFAIPLTQEDIGDATGLTSVHVNRMMRGLVDDGIIERSGNNVRLIDERRLSREAGYMDRSRIDTSWLPPPK